jgi:Flp pilus assembly pilin Flp
MARLLAAAKRFWTGVQGASLVEYALLLTLVAVVTLAVIAILGNSLSSFFTSAASSI